MEKRQPWRLEVLVPGLILAVFLCDAAGRFVRIEALTFRADEAVTQFRSARNLGPYEPNRRYRNDRSNGDLAALSNQREYGVFREQEFTTDGIGFRNRPDPQAAPPEVLMIGTSFTAGSGNSDGQTLPVRLESLSGCRTYNAGNLYGAADSILDLARSLGMRDGLIIAECLERNIGEPDPVPPRRSRVAWMPYSDDVSAIYKTVNARLTISPLEILLRRIYKAFRNDRLLPNVHKEDVAVRHLRDGRPMLFLRAIEHPRRFDRILPYVDTYAKLRGDLHAAGFDLALVIVPEKLTVYRPLLREPVLEGAEGLASMGELERSARARGIPVVNLAPVLLPHACRALEDAETLYWVDDTHWNPRGIEVAAEAICDALGLRSRCGRRRPPCTP